MGTKLKTVFYFEGHPLSRCMFDGLKSSFSEQLLMPQCSTECLRRSFVSAAVSTLMITAVKCIMRLIKVSYMLYVTVCLIFFCIVV